MPKTSKREATRRAARIAKAHATQLPPLQVRTPSKPQKAPGYKPPARGITRYPWAIGLSLLIIAAAIFSLYYFQAGPFAKPPPQVVKHVTPPDLKLPNPSPCLKLDNKRSGRDGREPSSVSRGNGRI
jgi:peptidylprolyl isomerase